MNGTDELREHQDRCVPHLTLLHMFAGSFADAQQLPADVAAQVALATSAILAEAKAGARAALAGGNPRSANLSLLLARQARLEHAAADAIASAREAVLDGNVAALRQRLQRFETLTHAMWTVQRECGRPLSVIRAGGMRPLRTEGGR